MLTNLIVVFCRFTPHDVQRVTLIGSRVMERGLAWWHYHVDSGDFVSILYEPTASEGFSSSLYVVSSVRVEQ